MGLLVLVVVEEGAEKEILRTKDVKESSFGREGGGGGSKGRKFVKRGKEREREGVSEI